jgi:hypothetical protein
MLTWKEYKFIFFTLCVSLIFSFSIFHNKLDTYHILIFALALEAIVKAIYDIKNKTGHQGMYIYNDKKNQILRYLVLLVVIIFFSAYIYYIFNYLAF